MSGYLLGIIGTVLFSAVLMMVAPEGKSSTVIKATARLVCLVSILLPVLSFLQSGKLFEENFTDFGIQADGNFIEYCSTISIESAEKEMEYQLENEFGVDCSVRLFWKQSEEKDGIYSTLKIKILKVQVKGSFSAQQAQSVEQWIEKEYACETEVIE